MSKKKRKGGVFHVKIRVDLQPYKRQYYTGIVFADNAEVGAKLAISQMVEGVNEKDPSLGLKAEHITVIWAKKLQDDFHVNQYWQGENADR